MPLEIDKDYMNTDKTIQEAIEYMEDIVDKGSFDGVALSKQTVRVLVNSINNIKYTQYMNRPDARFTLSFVGREESNIETELMSELSGDIAEIIEDYEAWGIFDTITIDLTTDARRK